MAQKVTIGKFYNEVIQDKVVHKATRAFAFCIIQNGLDKVKYEGLSVSEVEKLLVVNICSINNGLLIVKNIEAIAIGLYEYYRDEDKFEENVGFNSYDEFFSKISESLKLNVYNHKKKEILRSLLALLLIRYSLQGNSFESYIKLLVTKKHAESTNTKLEDFVSAFGIALPEIQLNMENLFTDIVLIVGLNEQSVNHRYLLEGLRVLPASKKDFALSLFEVCCRKPDSLGKIIISLTAGLYETIGEAILQEKFQPHLSDERAAEHLILGLSIVKVVGHNSAIRFLDLYEKNKGNEFLIVAMSKMLLNIIRTETKYKEKEMLVAQCFNNLENMIVRYGTVPSLQIINQIAFIDGYENQKTNLILTLISQPFFKAQEFLGMIEMVYWYMKDVKSMIQVLSAISDKEPFQDLMKGFKNILVHCSKIELDLAVIDLITDNRSSRRYLGNSLFNANSLQVPYTFNYDILSLAPLDQYKLWVGLCQNIGEPKSYLVAIISLLNSKSATVRESFIFKLEKLSEDYGGHITEILENCMDVHNSPEVTLRLKEYIEDFYRNNVDCKKGIAELDPYQTQCKLIKEFNKLHDRNFSKSIQKGAREESVLGMIGKTIKLGKGGGWKLPGEKSVKKLGHFQSGMVMPRNLFIYAEKYNIEHGMEQRIDRNEEDFDFIKQLIDNE